jgi:hypothetical protein
MKIVAKITEKGIDRTIDFQGARLPDGREIQEILNENERFKKEITDLYEKSSLLSKIIPWKHVRDGVEIIMFVFGIIGIIQMILLVKMTRFTW